MVTHYIVMSSSYSMGKRIGLDFIIENDKKISDEIINVVSYISEKCGKDVSLSTHVIQTDSTKWKSVLKRDYFFKEVEIINSIEKFIDLIERDRKLIGLDVAKYILSKIQCTHLKLEKLVYMCFAEYLCNFGKELYEDKIYAYRYGPVTKSVYEKYRFYGYNVLENKDIKIDNVYELPAKSRILFARDGAEKIKSIDDTLNKYGNYTARELVEITHKKDTPWEISGGGLLKNKEIKNESILKHHINESI